MKKNISKILSVICSATIFSGMLGINSVGAMDGKKANPSVKKICKRELTKEEVEIVTVRIYEKLVDILNKYEVSCGKYAEGKNPQCWGYTYMSVQKRNKDSEVFKGIDYHNFFMMLICFLYEKNEETCGYFDSIEDSDFIEKVAKKIVERMTNKALSYDDAKLCYKMTYILLSILMEKNGDLGYVSQLNGFGFYLQVITKKWYELRKCSNKEIVESCSDIIEAFFTGMWYGMLHREIQIVIERWNMEYFSKKISKKAAEMAAKRDYKKAVEEIGRKVAKEAAEKAAAKTAKS